MPLGPAGPWGPAAPCGPWAPAAPAAPGLPWGALGALGARCPGCPRVALRAGGARVALRARRSLRAFGEEDRRHFGFAADVDRAGDGSGVFAADPAGEGVTRSGVGFQFDRFFFEVPEAAFAFAFEDRGVARDGAVATGPDEEVGKEVVLGGHRLVVGHRHNAGASPCAGAFPPAEFRAEVRRVDDFDFGAFFVAGRAGFGGAARQFLAGQGSRAAARGARFELVVGRARGAAQKQSFVFFPVGVVAFFFNRLAFRAEGGLGFPFVGFAHFGGGKAAFEHRLRSMFDAFGRRAEFGEPFAGEVGFAAECCFVEFFALLYHPAAEFRAGDRVGHQPLPVPFESGFFGRVLANAARGCAVVGAGHRRAAEPTPKKPWTGDFAAAGAGDVDLHRRGRKGLRGRHEHKRDRHREKKGQAQAAGPAPIGCSGRCIRLASHVALSLSREPLCPPLPLAASSRLGYVPVLVVP